MQIGTNSIAQTAVRAIHLADSAVATASERISTGFRINRAADDPVGMALGNAFKTQITSMTKAIDNVNQGYALTQVADSTLSQLSDVLGYLKTYATNLLAGSYTGDALTAAQNTFDGYVSSYNSLLSASVFNGIDLMSSGSVTIQSGTSASDQITIDLTDMSMTLNAGSDVATGDLSTITSQISTLSAYQSYMGAMANVMTVQSDALTSISTAYSSAYGNIMNADLAQETANLAAAQIQRDGATAMLAQANGMNKEIVAFLLKSVTS